MVEVLDKVGRIVQTVDWGDWFSWCTVEEGQVGATPV